MVYQKKNLACSFEVRNPGNQELSGKLIVRHSDASNFIGEFATRRIRKRNLKAGFSTNIVFPGPQPKPLHSQIYIRPRGSRTTGRLTVGGQRRRKYA